MGGRVAPEAGWRGCTLTEFRRVPPGAEEAPTMWPLKRVVKGDPSPLGLSRARRESSISMPMVCADSQPQLRVCMRAVTSEER